MVSRESPIPRSFFILKFHFGFLYNRFKPSLVRSELYGNIKIDNKPRLLEDKILAIEANENRLVYTVE